jgi:hypothetical protein
MVFSLEHDIKVTKNHQNLLPTQSVLVAHTVVNVLEADFKLTCDCRTCCHGNGVREKDDAYW